MKRIRTGHGIAPLLVLILSGGAYAIAAMPTTALANGPGRGNGNGAHQDHTCQGGHNCNTTTIVQPPAATPTPAPTPAAPQSAPAPATSTADGTSSATANPTAPSTITVTIVQHEPLAATARPKPAAAKRAKRAKRCRTVHVRAYRKVWHRGHDHCGRLVRWYTYRAASRQRRVCVS